MQKKRIILAAAIMSMSLIAFMSMNNGRAPDIFSVSSAAPNPIFPIDGGQKNAPVDAIAMFEQWK
ncbi:hypothetical protein CR51_15065 [Caballeronia megalochromosomata]|jgi:Flp pilus assembly protein CpaB|nr:hypothetical protein CR51_15065 [Caballeronia megalochromosomata]